eukprot:2340832-Pyramimonas_sp.AAC.1
MQQQQQAQQPPSGVDVSAALTAFGIPVPEDMDLEDLEAFVASSGGKIAEGEAEVRAQAGRQLESFKLLITKQMCIGSSAGSSAGSKGGILSS